MNKLAAANVEQLAPIFRALGDPVRLEMVQRLVHERNGGHVCTIADVSAGLGITRQGARKHLQVLVDAGLVVLQPKGRDVLVQLDPEILDRAKAFLARLEQQWDDRLAALKQLMESGPTIAP